MTEKVECELPNDQPLILEMVRHLLLRILQIAIVKSHLCIVLGVVWGFHVTFKATF